MTVNDGNTEPARQRRIALVAHDGRKQDMREWAEFNRDLLAGHQLYATGTTGRILSEELGLPVTRFQSGPFGGDQQIGARIADGGIDLLVFFWDPMEQHPHDHDVKALLRVAVLWNIPIACNRATADFLITSPLMSSYAVEHEPTTRRQGLPGSSRPSELSGAMPYDQVIRGALPGRAGRCDDGARDRQDTAFASDAPGGRSPA